MQWLSGLSFGAPWILAGLAVLPALWWLLRVTPPAPQRVVFPPLRLLLGLHADEQTPARTPWWLLALRLIALAALIIALAEPEIGRPAAIGGRGPLVLFVDNGWTAAHDWDVRRGFLDGLLSSAARNGRGVAIVATAGAVASVDLLDAGKAERIAQELEPQPWLPDRRRAADAVARANFSATPEIVWLSDGIDDGHGQEVAHILRRAGHLQIYGPAPGGGPLALKPPVKTANGLTLTAMRADASGPRDGEIAALGSNGENLAAASFHFKDGDNKAETRLMLPLELRNQTGRLVIRSEGSAGAVQLMDSGDLERRIGIVSAGNAENRQPLLSDVYYLERALSPYAEIRKGDISELIAQHVAVLLLADIGTVGGSDAAAVAKFVSSGGVLIRFAGERMANGVDDLVPVKLRSGGRYLGSAMAWSEPQHLAPFAEESLFYGLEIPSEVTVSRQILAEPSAELADHIWARLTDGTPLVTATSRGNGWIVLFHITAGPTWSSLPLSGLYVDMLRRLLGLASGLPADDLASQTSLPPVVTIDGFGRAVAPPAEATPIRSDQIGHTVPSRIHPPGLYGNHGAETAINTVGRDDTLLPLGDLGQRMESAVAARTTALESPLLGFGLILLLADALISLVLRGYVARPRFLARGATALVAALLAFHGGHARADDAFALKAALNTRLAYVETGLPDVDAMSKAGLTGLGAALSARTSYEPEAPMGVDIEHDDLAFFPLLYWPMDPRERDLSPQAISKISDFMRNGGTILFDTRDLTLGPIVGSDSPGELTLKRLTAKLDMPPIEPIPADHVITKTFYIIRRFSGRWDSGKVWIQTLPPAEPGEETAPARGGDGVSPVIIGGNDWAAAWAVDSRGRPLVEPVPGGEQQRETAIRFGINLVIYALTGNYKTDVVHATALLERMGK